VASVIFAALSGVAMAFVSQLAWPDGAKLNFANRKAVVRSVLRGEPITDPLLAPAVLSYIAAIRRASGRDVRYRWVPWLFAGITVLLAIVATAQGSTRRAVTMWVLCVGYALLLPVLPRTRERRLRKASIAEASARALLNSPPTDA